MERCRCDAYRSINLLAEESSLHSLKLALIDLGCRFELELCKRLPSLPQRNHVICTGAIVADGVPSQSLECLLLDLINVCEVFHFSLL